MPDYYNPIPIDLMTPEQRERVDLMYTIREEVKSSLKENQETQRRERLIKEYNLAPLANEPKLKNSFEFRFPEKFGIDSYLVQTADRPKIKINESVKGCEWLPVSIQILELTNNSTLNGIQKMLSENKGFDCTFTDLDCAGVALDK
jgi:hypothetical protein